MEELFKTLPQHSCTWLPGDFKFYKYQDFWCAKNIHLQALLAQENFKAQPSDIFVCSLPKSGTTWLKALTFAIVTRKKFDESTSPLLTNLPHKCVPFLEAEFEKIQENHNTSLYFPLVATHLPYHCLPKSIITSNCKIVYIYRNLKDVIVSNYHYVREAVKVPIEDAPIEETFEEFCQGISAYGPYWDHILGYLKASLEEPGNILLLKYEDLQMDPVSNVKKLAEFIGYPFTTEEEKTGVVENIIKLCSFDNLSNLEVNKTGKQTPKKLFPEIQHRLYFRKGKDGDWKNYLTDEMTEKLDKVIDEKMSGTGLVLK